jgi:hypothetical protein
MRKSRLSLLLFAKSSNATLPVDLSKRVDEEGRQRLRRVGSRAVERIDNGAQDDTRRRKEERLNEEEGPVCVEMCLDN